MVVRELVEGGELLGSLVLAVAQRAALDARPAAASRSKMASDP